jgi:hypothetical protein
MSVWKSSLSSKIYKERENTSSKYMKARARSRHLKRLQQTFYDADYVTDGRLIYEYVHATDADLRARARTLHEHEHAISITLHDDEDDEEEEEEEGEEDDGGGGGDDNNNGNSNSASTSSTSSSITVRATNTPDNTLAPRWVRVSSLEQFIVSEARCRMSNEETAELARLFLQLVPVLVRSPQPLPLPPHQAQASSASASLAPEALSEEAASEASSMAPAMLEALQFVALKRSIDAYLQHGIGSGSGSGGPPSASSQDTRKEKRPTAPNSLWTVQDGMHIYLAHRIAVSETFASHPPTSRQLRHSQWYGARADQQPQPGHVLAIDAFVRTSFRHAFPQIVADLDNGRRDDDVRRICLAGEFYVRERVPLVAHECIQHKR